MKFKRIFDAALAAAVVLTVSANAAAIGRDTSGYAFRVGRAGRAEVSAP